MYKYLFRTALGLMGLMGTLSIGVVNAQEVNKDIILEATATESGQTLKINKYFANAYTVDRGEGNGAVTLSSDTTHRYTTPGTYTIILSLTRGATRWTFQDRSYPSKGLIPTNGTTMTGVKITSMPSLEDGFGNNATEPGDYFFNSFNSNGAITDLPVGSFDTSNITTVGKYFFMYFNRQGKLTSLPTGSFDTSKITTVGDNFFSHFNDHGALKSLPDNSFRLSTGLTTAGFAFFSSFNGYGQLTTLPEGSFDTSKITAAGAHFFASFNDYGQLTTLPEDSFDTSKITTASICFFEQFNRYGQLTTLPEGSFDTSKITTAGDDFFEYFNYNGHITSLPDSFKLTSAAYNKSFAYSSAFNSPSYTLNRNVSDLVSGVTAPIRDQNVFSDNQPGRCGVQNNWLVTTSNACHIVYDANGGTGTTTGGYVSNATGVAAGTGIKLPTKEGYALSEWRDISGNRVDEVIFPDMDGETLYAQWEECDSGYVVNSTGTLCVLKEYTITYNLGGGYLEDRTGNKYEGNQVVTYTYSSIGNKYVANIEREYVKRENSTFLGWYSSGGELFDFGTISPEKNMAFAKYECDFGYIENESSTACERIRVDFDANGGKFSGNSDIYSIIKSKQVIRKKAEVHTANLDDNDNYTNEFNGQLMNGYTTSIAPYTSGGITTYSIYSPTIVYFEKENVEKFDVSIKYGGGPYCNDIGYIIVWTGNHIQFDQNYNPSNTGLSLLYIDDFPSFGKNSEKSVEIEGNSFTIFQNNGCPSYGFFANISWTGVDFTYEENAFDNIPEPTREGHKFVGWYLSDGTEFNAGTVSTGEVTHVYAKWECADGYENKGGECVKKSSGSSGGGGGGGGGGSLSSCKNLPANAVANNSSTPSSNTNYYYSTNTSKVCTFQCKSGYTRNEEKGTCDKAPDSQTTTGTNVKEPETNTGSNAQTGSQQPLSPQQAEQASDSSPDREQTVTPLIGGDGEARGGGTQTYTQEFQEAYEFAHEKGITTMPTIQKADMNGKLTRIAMAKMLSQYAINILGKTPDTSQSNKFNDVTDKLDSDYDDGVTLAYQLGIMGQNMPGNKFRPDDEVTRAEFATALSRMLYNTSDGQYKSTDKYYTNHMSKLVKEGIITKDDPKMKELRGYVMIMLMRSAK